MAKNFLPHVAKEKLQIQQVGRIPNRKNFKKHKPRHIIIKLLKTKDKDKILKKMPFDFYFSRIKVFYISSSL